MSGGKEDWIKPLIEYLEHGRFPNDPRVRADIKTRAPRFIFRDGMLFRRSFEGLFLQCLDKEEAYQKKEEVHSGTCGAHQSGPKHHFSHQENGLLLTNNGDGLLITCIEVSHVSHAIYIHQSQQARHQTIASCPFNTCGLDVVGPPPKS